MTDTRNQARQRRGIETRGGLRGTNERRYVGTVGDDRGRRGSQLRSAAQSADSAVVTGQPIVYATPYEVHDAYGSFTETIDPGALMAVLKSGCDCRMLVNHQGLPLARTTSGTLKLESTPKALVFSAQLDTRQTIASDLVLAIDRDDVTQMSCGFVVGDDTWSADYSKRVIHTFAELFDVSAVTYPASPTTSIEILEDELPPEGGPDGTAGGSGTDTGPGSQDGTGSRAHRHRVQVDMDMIRLGLPPLADRRKDTHE
jgi:uncharacterized protein